MAQIDEILARLPQWSELWPALAALFAAALVALGVHRALFTMLDRLAKRTESPLDEIIFKRLYRPLRWAMVAIAISVAAQFDPLLQRFWEAIGQFAIPALLGWIAYTLVKAFAYALEYRIELTSEPVAARSRKTRVAIFSRIATFVIVFVTVGLMLLAIPGVREIGITLMASAGLAALAVGAAAQPALKSLIAGLRLALSEPLRIGDLVVVDGYTGRVEEIRMGFVVVRIWDERAVMVPTDRFLDQSFENWSRVNEQLTGTVFLHLDPATPVEPIRQEFLRYIDSLEEWDHRKAEALVTEAYPESIEIRLAMSGRTIGELFQLRCKVREHMLAWLRENLPDALIRHRLEVEAANERVKKKN